MAVSLTTSFEGDRCFGYQSNVDSVAGYRRMGTSAEWDRIYDVRHDTCGNTICDRSINRIGYRNSEIVKEPGRREMNLTSFFLGFYVSIYYLKN